MVWKFGTMMASVQVWELARLGVTSDYVVRHRLDKDRDRCQFTLCLQTYKVNTLRVIELSASRAKGRQKGAIFFIDSSR